MTRCGPRSAVNGALAGVRPDDLASRVIKAPLERHPHLDGGAIDEVIFGNANGAGEDNRISVEWQAYWPGFR
jgi:acetyl-CoA acyltransferase